MKIRSDYVTNSSSSSFLLAHKGKLNERQKKAILDYVESAFFGTQLLDSNCSEEEYQEVAKGWDFNENQDKEIRKALSQGNNLYAGGVDFYDDYDHSSLYYDIWDLAEKNADPDSFIPIDTDLYY